MSGQSMTTILNLNLDGTWDIDKTWDKCLAMWDWITEQVRSGDLRDVPALKCEWFLKNEPRTFAYGDCFFCQHAFAHKRGVPFCAFCPGRLVDPKFDCGAVEYHWYSNPIKFCEKLHELNAIRTQSGRNPVEGLIQ